MVNVVVVLMCGTLLFSQTGRLYASLLANGVLPWSCAIVPSTKYSTNELRLTHLVFAQNKEVGRFYYGERYVPAGRDAVDGEMMYRHQLASVVLWTVFSSAFAMGVVGLLKIIRSPSRRIRTYWNEG